MVSTFLDSPLPIGDEAPSSVYNHTQREPQVGYPAMCDH